MGSDSIVTSSPAKKVKKQKIDNTQVDSLDLFSPATATATTTAKTIATVGIIATAARAAYSCSIPFSPAPYHRFPFDDAVCGASFAAIGSSPARKEKRKEKQ